MLAPRPRSIEYGFARLDPRLERYQVPGEGAIWISLESGDRLTVRDPEGGQVAEIAVLGASGQDDAAALSARSDSQATGLRDILRRAGEAALPVTTELGRRRIDLNGLRAVQLFGGETSPGASQTFTAQRSITCIVSAPGTAMEPDQQTPPTALEVTIERIGKANTDDVPLPLPLAEPRLDFRIDRCTARSYEVQEGEFVQIIDVSGRQCSDLLVFDAARLQKGVERCFDSTMTRTLMAAAYPGPGLHSKYFDQDMQPLLEIVQDTVGRHDTFLLACYARGYDDMGYPGHPNCTDNLNAALKPYGVTPRPGWPAINLFSNTGFTSNLQVYVNEPYTRPGDYVLVRASKALVCGSSACPDDVNPTNGWNPTDIHVRVYPAKNKFSKAVGHRMTPESELKLTRETAFHPRTSALTRDFSDYRGYWVPNAFDNLGPVKEYFACREQATIMDLSPLRKFEILGPDAEELLQRTSTRDVRRMAVGQVVYAAFCYESGGMIDDGTLFRLGQNNFRWIGGDDFAGTWLRQQAADLGLNAQVKSATDQLHNFSLQGPNSRRILESAIWTPTAATRVADLERFRLVVGRVGDFNGPTVVVSRTGYTGELGYEVWCHPKDASTVWDAVWTAGEPHGLKPMGMAALDILRIEAGLVFAGYEFDDQTDPFEAGIGFVVDAGKEEDFVGKAAILKRKAAPQRRLVGLEMTGNETVGHGEGVYVGRSRIGVVTSGTRSPVLKKNIALARLTTEFAAPGTEVEVGKLDGHQKRLPATVVTLPFYDPHRTRVRS